MLLEEYWNHCLAMPPSRRTMPGYATRLTGIRLGSGTVVLGENSQLLCRYAATGNWLLASGQARVRRFAACETARRKAAMPWAQGTLFNTLSASCSVLA